MTYTVTVGPMDVPKDGSAVVRVTTASAEPWDFVSSTIEGSIAMAMYHICEAETLAIKK